MADERVHPRQSPSQHEDGDKEEVSKSRAFPPSPQEQKPITKSPQPAAGTYVIQIPKDQIYRVPPPENAERFKRLSRRKPSRPCCCCCRFFCFTLLPLILLLAIASGIFYLIFRPEAPHYSINSISIKPLNLSSSSSSPISPQFNISVTAENPNDHIGIYYETDSSVKAYYQDVDLCDGILPDFYQPNNNVTIFNVHLKGSTIQLATSVQNQLVAAEKSETVPLRVYFVAPVKIKVGSVKTWTVKVKVNCHLTVDKLTSQSKIMSRDCDYKVKLWRVSI